MRRSMGTSARLPIGYLVIGWLLVAAFVSLEFATGHGALAIGIFVASAIGATLGRWQLARARRAKSAQQHADPDVGRKPSVPRRDPAHTRSPQY